MMHESEKELKVMQIEERGGKSWRSIKDEEI